MNMGCLWPPSSQRGFKHGRPRAEGGRDLVVPWAPSGVPFAESPSHPRDGKLFCQWTQRATSGQRQECEEPHWAPGSPLPRERGRGLRWGLRWELGRELLGGRAGGSTNSGAAEISHTAAQTYHPRTRGPSPMRVLGCSHRLTARVTNEPPTDVFCLACRVLLKI